MAIIKEKRAAIEQMVEQKVKKMDEQESKKNERMISLCGLRDFFAVFSHRSEGLLRRMTMPARNYFTQKCAKFYAKDAKNMFELLLESPNATNVRSENNINTF